MWQGKASYRIIVLAIIAMRMSVRRVSYDSIEQESCEFDLLEMNECCH